MTLELTDIDEYLAVPLIIQSYSVELDDGTWVRRVRCEELPGCVAESESIVEALGALEAKRAELTRKLLDDGEVPPNHRAPIRGRPRR
jgi:predicted RNase H-like HicB family nuclease